ncbi:insulysin [Nematocida homosporus]|uniref:insulysin n=1 Tax=Nematocida homosporus TaxID=1912981 RepID=UPI00221EA923|nr:insulysin [Nematocida homosporus]KAI5187515.1 insulysin [Nematocida homosporus]
MISQTKANRLLFLVGLVMVGLSFANVISRPNKDDEPNLFRNGQIYTNLQGSLDHNSYKTIILPNKLQVVLITTPESETSAACLTVQVGSMHNPSDHPGLAHFLEHMLFMGTEAYSNVNDYNQFLQDHGGSSNAATSLEYTTYYFDVSSDYLGKALDIFSGFFKYPLIKAQYLEKELDAVHNEMEKGMGNDVRRSFILGQHLTDPESLLSKFGDGSRETLKDTKREHLLCFWKQYYRPDKMRLVVYGQESHDVLEGYVRAYFSDIKTHTDHEWIFSDPPYELLDDALPKPNETDTSHELTRPDLQNKLVYYKPQSPKNTTTQLTVKINLPQSLHAYEEKTVSFIVSVFNEGKELNGFNLLINNSMIVSASCSSSKKTTVSSITVAVNFKSSTQPQIESVLNLIQAKLEMVRQMGTQELYDTYKKIFQDRMEDYSPSGPRATALEISRNLPWIALEDIFSLSYQWEAFNAQEFYRFVNIALDRSKWLVMVRTNEMPADTPLQTEPYYGIEYAVVDLTGNTDAKIDSVAQQMEWDANYVFEEVDLTMARENNQLSAKFGSFITNTNLCPFIEQDKQEYAISHSEPGLDAHLIHNKDITTKKTRVTIVLKTQEFEKDAAKHVAFRGYISAYLKKFDSKHREQIRISNTNISSLTANTEEVCIIFYGYPLVIQSLIDLFFVEFADPRQDYLAMVQFAAPTMFEKLQYLKPLDACVSLGFRMYTQTQPFTPTELIAAAKNIKLEDIIVVSQAKITIFVFGNTTENEFHHIIATVKKHVTPTPAPQTAIPGTLSTRIELPAEDKLNNAIMLIHEVTEFSPMRNFAIAALICQIEKELVHTQLRTEEELGYIASCERIHGYNKDWHLVFIVQGSKGLAHTETRIQAFIQGIGDHIAGLSDDDFKKHQVSLITKLKQKPANITDYARRVCLYWENIEEGLEAKAKTQAMITSLAKEEVAAYMRHCANDFVTICSSNKFAKSATAQSTQ